MLNCENDSKVSTVMTTSGGVHKSAPQTNFGEHLRLALIDVMQAMSNFQFWGYLGWHDIKQRYRRSLLGPFWITLSTAVMVGALGILYSTIFKQSVENYVPFLAIGLVMWNYILTCITDSCMVYMSAEGIIKNVKLPLTVHVMRMIWRNLIIFAHNFVIIVAVLMYFRVPVSWEMLWFPVGLMVVTLNCFWLAMFLAILSARFRDVPQIVINIMQMVFFITPIIWKPEILVSRRWLAEFNPFYYLIELVRAPALGQPVPLHVWIASATISVMAAVLAISFFAKFRARIAYWL